MYKKPKSAKFKVVILGKDLVGLKYKPLFNYFYEDFKDTGFRVIPADYVTNDSGRVHQAHPMVKRISTVPKPQESSTKRSCQALLMIQENGINVPEIAGMYFKDKVIIKKFGRR